MSDAWCAHRTFADPGIVAEVLGLESSVGAEGDAWDDADLTPVLELARRQLDPRAGTGGAGGGRAQDLVAGPPADAVACPAPCQQAQ